MTERPEDRSEERRRAGRTGPLGDDDAGESRREDPEATRQIPAERFRRDPSEERTVVDESVRSREGEKETRVIRTPGAREERQDTGAYPRGYFEAAEEREARLRDIYGGVDWLASFLGCIFALVAAAFFSFIAGLILVPLGFTLDLGGQLGATIITGLVLVGVLIFLTYLFGGYVAGRLARFDGGRNGAMSVVWTLLLGAAILAVGGFLPGRLFEVIRDFIQDRLLPAIGGLLELGLVGAAIVVGALLLALLGGFLGGRLGSRYHSEIDRTT